MQMSFRGRRDENCSTVAGRYEDGFDSTCWSFQPVESCSRLCVEQGSAGGVQATYESCTQSVGLLPQRLGSMINPVLTGMRLPPSQALGEYHLSLLDFTDNLDA